MTDETRAAVMAFWEWFCQVHSQLGERFENQDLVVAIEERIFALGGYAFELGPGLEEDCALVISPRGKADLLGETTAIIALAPRVPGWEFHAAKPIKQWVYRFRMADESGAWIEVDASQWRFMVDRASPQRVRITALALDLPLTDPSFRRRSAEIVVDGLVGEACRIADVESVVAPLPVDFPAPGPRTVSANVHTLLQVIARATQAEAEVQRELCRRFRAPFLAALPDAKVGLSRSAREPDAVLNGLRHPPEGDTSGWYIWGGTERSDAPGFFEPVCVRHLADVCPDAVPFLGLAPGWRFLVDGTAHEDVWEDPALLDLSR